MRISVQYCNLKQTELICVSGQIAISCQSTTFFVSYLLLSDINLETDERKNRQVENKTGFISRECHCCIKILLPVICCSTFKLLRILELLVGVHCGRLMPNFCMTALSLNCYERSWNITNEFYGNKLVSKYFTIFRTF